jgi:transcriptional regulator with XRE-family HTH domain
MDTNEHSEPWDLSPNQVVAYNLGRAREARGWSQEEAGRRLEPFLGTPWSKATFSQAERSVDPGRSRGFSADEIVAFARCFGYPVTWFFLPPPPGTAGMPRRAETGETPNQYGRRLHAVLTQILGSYDQVDDLQQRVGLFAEEMTARNLADARDIVAESSGVLLDNNGPDAAAELRRWREALLGVAEGLGVMETEIKRRAGAALAPALRGQDLPEDGAEFDLRKIDLGLDAGAPSGRKRARERDQGIEPER